MKKIFDFLNETKKCNKCGGENFIKHATSLRNEAYNFHLCECGNVMMSSDLLPVEVYVPTPESDTVETKIMMKDAAESLGLPYEFGAINEEELAEKEEQAIDSLLNCLKAIKADIEDKLNEEDNDYDYDCDYNCDDCDDCENCEDCEDQEDEDEEDTAIKESLIKTNVFEQPERKNYVIIYEDGYDNEVSYSYLKSMTIKELTNHINNFHGNDSIISIFEINKEIELTEKKIYTLE